MASRIIMPKLTDSMEEGVVVKWRKSEGDHVDSGDVLAEIETDKAVMDLEAFASGTLRKILAVEGTTVPSGALIGVIAEPAEDIQGLLKEVPEPAKKAAAVDPTHPPQARQDAPFPGLEAVKEEAMVSTEQGEATASPRVRTLAREHGIDLKKVKGSGPSGRIVERDLSPFLTSAVSSQSAVPIGKDQIKQAGQIPARTPTRAARGKIVGEKVAEGPLNAEAEDVPLSQIRKAIARITTQSKAPIPHFYITADVDMGEAMRMVEESKSSRSSISINHLVITASARALRLHPGINASFAGDKIRIWRRIDIGIAVALEDGLIVPVVRDCGSKSLTEIAEEERALVKRTRNRELKPEEYTAATFLISNLGTYDIDNFIAVILPPAAAALAIGSVRDVPVVRNERVDVGRRMKITLSCDHRVIDGVAGAKFLQTLKQELEHPLPFLPPQGGG
ncbi:MAG: 2-oxo acid dehydrogenase subunit E2 [Nitrospirae bacterium]|nr:MAG: 2-oxo acid dehydrogenase subunit E2 [Nitrospirota bacterium]